MSNHEIYKFHGTGNDFIVLRDSNPLASAKWAAALCDRHRGVGADGLLILGEPEAGGDVRLTIINADGSRPEMCGNGVRCVARYLVEIEGAPEHLVVESDAGPRPVHVIREPGKPWQVAVDMGPAVVSGQTDEIELDGQSIEVRRASMGNPHAVCFVPIMPSLDVIDRWGAHVNDGHPVFPEGVNLEFVVASPGRFDVVVYERGVGRTEACGTGACAVAACAWHEHRTEAQSVIVGLPGGDLTIEQRGESVWMTGGVESVFRGSIDATWMNRRKG